MKNKKFILIMTVMFCLFTSCSAGNIKSDKKNEDNIADSRKADYQKITAEQAKNMMDDGDSYILLDVRTEEEFKENRIDGAILIPDYEINSRAEKELADKNVRILIYCRSGRRSALAAKEMIDMGYTDVYDFGGIIDWPYQTVKN